MLKRRSLYPEHGAACPSKRILSFGIGTRLREGDGHAVRRFPVR
jgi:hypothetical protein